MQLRNICNISKVCKNVLKVVKMMRLGIWLSGQSSSHGNLTVWVQIPRAHVKTRHSDVQVHNAFPCASVRSWNVDTWEMPEACKPAHIVVNKETLSQTRCKNQQSKLCSDLYTHSFGVPPHRHTYEHRHIYTYTRVSLRVVMITIIYFIWNRIQKVF